MTNSPPDPIAKLWLIARTWLAATLRDLGGPAEIARMLAAETRAVIKRRLAFIESLVMKLLLIEAARHPVAPTSGAKIAGAADKPARAVSRRQAPAEVPAQPETWRVRFRLRTASQCKRAPIPGVIARFARAQRGARDRDQAKATALARRFECLRRVLADPRRAISRLARVLRAFGPGARAVAHRIALARPPRAQHLGPTLADAIVRACDASFSFPGDTS